MTLENNSTTYLSKLSENDNNKNPIIWSEMTDLEKEILSEWAENTNSLNLDILIKVLHQKMKQTEGHSFYDKLQNMDFTRPNGNLIENIMVGILVVSYCRLLDINDGKETNTTPKLIELWNDFKSSYM